LSKASVEVLFKGDERVYVSSVKFEALDGESDNTITLDEWQDGRSMYEVRNEDKSAGQERRGDELERMHWKDVKDRQGRKRLRKGKKKGG
jgi:hypothetical protein